MPALPVKTTLFGALIVQLLSPPVVLVTPRPVKTRFLRGRRACHCGGAPWSLKAVPVVPIERPFASPLPSARSVTVPAPVAASEPSP